MKKDIIIISPGSSINIFIAKIIILTLVGTIGGYYLNEKGKESQEHLKQITFEQMQGPEFELFRARTFKPHIVAAIYMISCTLFLFAIFGAYELLARSIAKLIGKLPRNSTTRQYPQAKGTSQPVLPHDL